MSVFENAMKSHNVLENDPYDWEKCDSEDMLTITATATTAQQLTRLTPAYLGYLALKAIDTQPVIVVSGSRRCSFIRAVQTPFTLCRICVKIYGCSFI